MTISISNSDDTGQDRLIADLVDALSECITDPNAQCIVTSDVAYMIRRFKAINEIASQAILASAQRISK